MYSVDITVSVGKQIELDVSIDFECTSPGYAADYCDPGESPKFEVRQITPLTFYGSTFAARSCEPHHLRDWYPIVEAAAIEAVERLEYDGLLDDYLLEEYCVYLR